MQKWLVLAALLAGAPPSAAAIAECKLACRQLAVEGAGPTMQSTVKRRSNPYGIKPTGLKPKYPNGCSPLTSLYATWLDVDGTRRDELHSGVDGGRLGEPILAPAPGKVRRAWVADWGQGHEGALLIVHTREDLNLDAGPAFYYSAFYHLRHGDIKNLQEGDPIARGQHLANVFRPGGKSKYLPEVHLEVYEVGDDAALTWGVTERGTEYFDNPTYKLVDPLHLLSLEVRPTARHEVLIQPFDPQRDYRTFKGFTYFLPCGK
jgi:murein DD-endopeptidase MepM/ murein hydrolase activator NlpD